MKTKTKTKPKEHPGPKAMARIRKDMRKVRQLQRSQRRFFKRIAREQYAWAALDF